MWYDFGMKDMGCFDVLVVGAGHAGCEAAFAAARMGCATALVTASLDVLGLMPCNPAVGGLAKSHLVAELDALGGEMGFNADCTGLQYRTLNVSRGPAVRAVRVQCDKARYSARLAGVARRISCLTPVVGLAVDLVMDAAEPRRVLGVRLADGRCMRGHFVVLTLGTALGGRVWVGHAGRPSGGDARPATPLWATLATAFPELGWRRLKTGTPPRLLNASIDWAALEPQDGEVDPVPFFSRRMRLAQQALVAGNEKRDAECSTWNIPPNPAVWGVKEGFATYRPLAENAGELGFADMPEAVVCRAQAGQTPCFRTHTTPETHAIIRAHLADSALYGGDISGEGVRYCPSIEDKVVKFGDRGGHHVILEPEGAGCPWCYPNGLSNSLPFDVQVAMVRSVPGLSRAELVAPGYAIEYDCIDPRGLDARLAVKSAHNLFIAGQLNGTTGYEEAAAQGFLAGVNAALAALGREPLTLSRDEAYLGVMVDDLITKGTDEPYRMFTSRAERRLLLRPGDVHLRLHRHAARLGLVDAALLRGAEEEAAWLAATETAWRADYLDGNGLSRWKLLAREGVSFAEAAAAIRPGGAADGRWGGGAVPPDWAEELALRAKYEGYIAHERVQAERLRRDESLRIPEGFDYAAVRGLRFEAREKLRRIRPDSLRRAASIPGVNPADLALLSLALKKIERD